MIHAVTEELGSRCNLHGWIHAFCVGIVLGMIILLQIGFELKGVGFWFLDEQELFVFRILGHCVRRQVGLLLRSRHGLHPHPPHSLCCRNGPTRTMVRVLHDQKRVLKGAV